MSFSEHSSFSWALEAHSLHDALDTGSRQQTMTGRWRFTAKALVSAGLFGVILIYAPLGEVLHTLSEASRGTLVAAFSVMLLRHVLSSYRWQVLIRARGWSAGFSDLVSWYFIGLFFNLFLPSSIGGDTSRVYYAVRRGIPTALGFSSVLAERILGIFAVILLCAIPLATGAVGLVGRGLPGLASWLLTLAILVLAAAATLLWLRSSHPRRFLSSRPKLIPLVEELDGYFSRPSSVLRAFVLSIIFQCCGIFGVYLALASVYPEAVFMKCLFAVPLVYLVSLAPVSINGLGVREGALVTIFGLLGIPYQASLSTAFIWLAIVYLQGLVGFFVFLREKKDGDSRDVISKMLAMKKQ